MMHLPRYKAKKLTAMQRAVSLFDRIATLPNQVSSDGCVGSSEGGVGSSEG
jgi:hypothetical protein